MARFVDVRAVPVEQLVVSQQQARTREVEKDLDDLVDNIRVHGQLEPIIVAPMQGDADAFEIIAGQRRWLAMRRLGSDTILAAILAAILVEAGDLDIKAAVRIEDHFGEAAVPDAEVSKLARTVSGMTSAQQVDYFKGTPPSNLPAPREPDRPGSVRQIIVTLRQEDHAKLREWGAGRGLGQDKAAAWIINAFLNKVRTDGRASPSSTKAG
jgi:ParB-like nuclease family protein